MQATIKSYTLGFILSVLLTLTAYFIVANHLLTGWDLTLVIVVLALIQLWVQLIFFLHLNQEKGPKWNFAFFLSTTALILLVIVGSIWIMHNLSYHTVSNEEIMQEEGIYR